MAGDRLVRPLLRRLVRGSRAGGLDKVFANLCLGLDRLGIRYEVNLPFEKLNDDDRIGVLGVGRYALDGYRRSNPIVAGPGLMTHPSEWPDLCERYPVARYLQHSAWTNAVYERYFGDKCAIWPIGIDTEAWRPADRRDKRFDFLIYDKIMWRRARAVPDLLEPIRAELARRRLSFTEIRYGRYGEPQYRQALRHSKAMIFLCEHESQGIAYQECLASGVPILAWDQGAWLDPNRFAWGDPEIAATSVPYFDARCGMRFRGINEFSEKLTEFIDRRPHMAPRDYIVENLTTEKCSAHYLRLLDHGRNIPGRTAVTKYLAKALPGDR